MSFLKRYNGTTDPRLLNLERITWLLIYAGLLAMPMAFFSERAQLLQAGVWYAVGLASVGLGVLMIYLRSRLTERG